MKSFSFLLCLALAATVRADEPDVVYNDLDVSAGGAWAEPVRLHRDTYAAWLAETDYNTWTNYTDGTTVTGSFTTADAEPRWLSSPIFGWTEGGKETYTMNFRDLGGWELAGGNGRRTNFNVFFRSGHLDRHFYYRDCRKGCPLSHEFHLKTELELRGDFPVTNAPAARIDDEVYYFTTNRNSIVKTGVGFTTSPCDDSGTIRYYRVGFSDGIKTSLGSATTELRDAFRVLGKKANHPVVFHCAGGRDRTGLLAFLVEALVGLREIDSTGPEHAAFELAVLAHVSRRFDTMRAVKTGFHIVMPMTRENNVQAIVSTMEEHGKSGY